MKTFLVYQLFANDKSGVVMNFPDLPPTLEGISDLINLLRGPNGCPWDRKQTADSLTGHLIEECYELVEAIEKKFDHNYHQAVFEVETDDFEQGIVVQEVQTGFMMYDRLLRPSMVAVSKKPENKKKNQEKE